MLRRNIGKKNQKITSVKKSGSLAFPKTVWGFYLKYAIPGSTWALIAWSFCVLISTSESLLFPMILRWFVALFEADVPTGMTLFQYALPTILLIAGCLLVLDSSELLRSFFMGRWSPQTRNNASVVLNDYVHSQSMSFWTGRMAGKVHKQITDVSEGINVFVDLWSMVCFFLMLVLNIGLIFSVNKWLVLLFVLSMAFRAVYSAFLIKPLHKASKANAEAGSELSGKNIDSVSNYSVVKLFAGMKRERKYLEPVRKKKIDTHIVTYFWQRMIWGVPMVMWDICYVVVLFLCIWLYARGQITVSEIVYAASVFMNVMGLVGMIVRQIPTITDTLGAATKAYSELVVPIDVMDNENASELSVKQGKIEIKNLSFKYKRKWVLRDLNLTIKPGERVGVVGPSGAGKSTLVHLLMRFYDPNHGQILIDNQDIRDVQQDSLRENIAFIPQEPTMFNRTLRENIEYGRPGATNAQIKQAARQASADEFIMGTEKKYESMVGDRGIKLSGGQKQRIAIARAFLKDAPILILDEATSALDSETEVAIQKSFEQLAAGRTTVAIAHRLSTLRNMDRIIVLKDGHIIEQGTHNALVRHGGEYARLWKMQSGGFLQE